MPFSSLKEIRGQEEDIFEELGSYDFQSEPQWKSSRDYVAKRQAKQQMEVSADSPFSRQSEAKLSRDELKKLRDERAQVLKAETDEIRRQLDLVKGRLSELKCKDVTHESDQVNQSTKKYAAQESSELAPSAVPQKYSRPAPTSQSSSPQTNQRQPISNNETKRQSEPKFRPLTGKADCPNCDCDRRSSICDLCASLNPPSSVTSISQSKSPVAANNTAQKTSFQRYDDRPIIPLENESEPSPLNETIDAVVVPGKVYAISRALNEKRTKLAQAIDELQLMIEQMKEKENRLNNERRVVQSYKDQWKYGPTIGGPKASSRERLGSSKELSHQRNYSSRIDPNLSRDSKSLMGFQHIESGMKLRQYSPSKSSRVIQTKLNQSKSSINQVNSMRSKSLESLRDSNGQPKKISNSGNLQRAINNFHNGKSSSELHLGTKEASFPSPDKNGHGSATVDGDQDDEDNVEEDIEEIIEELPTSVDLPRQSTPDRVENQSQSGEKGEVKREEYQNSGAENIGQPEKRVQRMAWIPVFGETEVKTVKRVQPKRKVQILSNPSSRSSANMSMKNEDLQEQTQAANHDQTPATVQRTTRPKTGYGTCSFHSNYNRTNAETFNGGKHVIVKKTTNGKSKIVAEAERKLKFATDLLEQEKRDSATKNQLIINKTKRAPTIQRQQSNLTKTSNRYQASKWQAPNVGHSLGSRSVSNLNQASPQLDVTNKEIARLEAIVREQQRQLSRLTEQQDHQHTLLLSPLSVGRCSSPCSCHHCQPTCRRFQEPAAMNNNQDRSLIQTMRDRLHKTKLRLARILEEEREKHQQLKQKVDSSLRKQSDLENENELLKRSLSKCIDTCLKDISSTFESLSDTLANSMNDSGTRILAKGETTVSLPSSRPGSGSSNPNVLTNAAQLISDNRYLKQMKNHIESIEQQRRGIFAELSKEKQRNKQLESELKESKAELNRLATAKQRLEESQLLGASKRVCDNGEAVARNSGLDDDDDDDDDDNNDNDTRQSEREPDRAQASTSKQQSPIMVSSSLEPTASESDKGDLEDTFSSVDIYRQYIESMSPNIESIRRERKMILDEFDNIKKMLSNIEK